MTGVANQILFSPDNVAGVLADMRAVAALIPEPAIEGVPSEAFPKALRKTQRELYRWIANTHYSHLAEVVVQLERVHAAGCTFGNLLTTRSREQFSNLTAEVLVADDLLRRGFAVSTIPLLGAAGPDLRVDAHGVDVAIEVYSPRELIAVDSWLQKLSDLINFADVRASCSASITTKLEAEIPPPRMRTPPDPWAADKLLAATGDAVFEAVARDVDQALRELAPLDSVYRHEDTPLVTTVELAEVREAPNEGPLRMGTISAPGFGGYSPAGVFRTIVERAQRKAKRRQAEGVVAAVRALVVYLMGTKIAEDIVHPAHLSLAEGAAREIDPQTYGLDVIAFVVRAMPEGLAAVLTVADDATLTVAQIEALFGSTS